MSDSIHALLTSHEDRKLTDLAEESTEHGFTVDDSPIFGTSIAGSDSPIFGAQVRDIESPIFSARRVRENYTPPQQSFAVSVSSQNLGDHHRPRKYMLVQLGKRGSQFKLKDYPRLHGPK